MEILVRLGDLTEEEIRMRCEGDGRLMLEELGRDGRAVPVRISTDVRWVAGEDASVYGDLSQDPHLRVALQRYLQSHGPVSTHQLAGRYGQAPERIAAIASLLGASGAFIRGRFRVPQEGSAGEEWCYRPNVGRLHRQTLTILRHEITPSSLPAFTRFLCGWQHATPRERLTGPSAVQDILAQFAGASLPAEIWDRDLLPSRIRTYTGSQLQQAAASGEIVWIGTGPGRMMPVLRGEGSTFLGASQEATEQSEAARRILEYLRASGASFLRDIRNATRIPLHTINHAITELFWDGRITNDVFTEITAIPLRGTAMDAPLERLEPTIRLRTPGRSRILASARRSIQEVPGWSGRWSMTDHPGIRGEELGDDERVRHQVDQLLDRYGIVARELHRRENLLSWPILASELQHREMLGLIRRGYFVEGLAGMQYALPAAVEMLRSLQRKMADPDEVIVLNACDPANPYGSGVPLPASDSAGQTRLQRTPGTYLVIRNGVPRTLLENFGARAWSLGEPDWEAMKEGYRYIQRLMLPSSAGRKLRKAVIEYVDGERPAGSSVEALLRDLGFSRDMDQTMRFDV
jgi:ATP-dependent Lhr-like helicase